LLPIIRIENNKQTGVRRERENEKLDCMDRKRVRERKRKHHLLLAVTRKKGKVKIIDPYRGNV